MEIATPKSSPQKDLDGQPVTFRNRRDTVPRCFLEVKIDFRELQPLRLLTNRDLNSEQAPGVGEILQRLACPRVPNEREKNALAVLAKPALDLPPTPLEVFDFLFEVPDGGPNVMGRDGVLLNLDGSFFVVHFHESFEGDFQTSLAGIRYFWTPSPRRTLTGSSSQASRGFQKQATNRNRRADLSKISRGIPESPDSFSIWSHFDFSK